MLWTLAAFLGILSILLLHFLSSIIGKIKASFFVYPSEAIVDQVLPMEIMEHIMTFLDPHGVMQSRFVSKYWRYHASKKIVKTAVMDAYDTMLESLPIKFTTDAASKTDFRDRAVAGTHGKILISLPHILPPLRFKSLRKFANRYAIKATTTTEEEEYTFNSQGYSTLYCTPPIHPFKGEEWFSILFGSTVEVILDLESYLKTSTNARTPVKLYSYRALDKPKYFWFVPLDGEFLKVMMFILAPLIVRDVLFTPTFLQIVKMWCGPAIFVASLAIICLIFVDLLRYANDYHALTKPLMTCYLLGYVALAVLTYSYSSSYFAFIGMISISVVFIVSLKGYTFGYYGTRKRPRLGPLITVALLVLVMNDWKLTVECFKDASIWSRLFYNTVMYAIFNLQFIFIQFLLHLSRSRTFKWSYLVDWERSTVRMLMMSYSLVVWLTLYAPTWHGN